MEEFNINSDREVFKVPSDYFGNLNDRILKNTSEPEGAGRSTIALLRPWLSLAAVIAGTAILTTAIIRFATDYPQHGRVHTDLYADVPQFLIDGIDMYMIEYEMDAENKELISEQHGREDIIDYLMINEVELAMIYDYFND